MPNSKLTKEQIAQLVEDFNNGMQLKALEAKYGVNWSTASKIAIRNGATPRRVYSDKRPQKERPSPKAKTCAQCHKTVAVDGARFCPYCGNDIRTEKEILIEKIDHKLRGLYIYLPGQFRDEYMTTLNQIDKALKD